MSEFWMYFEIGMDHILDPNGYDHIMFVFALCALYMTRDWKKLLILVTSFTIGHSITLALATFRVINIDSDIVEFLIPVTIFLTAFSNILSRSDKFGSSKMQTNYILALFFGLIHGLGFSNYLRAILGKDQSILTQLFAFNVGLEAGQIILVAIYLATVFIIVDIFRVNRRDWRIIISAAIAGIALTMVAEAKYW
jgi:hypothetical protein